MEWQELADCINATSGHQLLDINFIEGLPPWMHYKRALIVRVVFHEGLFSICLGWEAIFTPFSNNWVWSSPQKDDQGIVQIIDADVTRIKPHICPNGFILVKYDRWTGDLTHSNLNPAKIETTEFPFPTSQDGPYFNLIDGGTWILPPHHKDFLLDPSKVKNVKDLQKI